MKVYIAGPMTGLPAHNYPAFNQVAEKITALGHEPLNPVEVADGEAHDWHWYMRRTLAMMLAADEVVLLPGWNRSRGARIERDLARKVGLRTSTFRMWRSRIGG